MDIITILQEILSPLPPDIFLAALISGLIFGALYNAKLELPRVTVLHFLRVGINFTILIFIFKFLYSTLVGAVFLHPLGWLGIGLLWSLYCLFIFIGQVAAEKFEAHRNSKEVKE